MNKPFLLAFFYILFFSCGVNPYDEGNSFKKIDQPRISTGSVISLDTYFNVVEVVRLESTEKSIIDYVYKLIKTDSVLFVKGGNSLFKFHSEGKFISKLTKGIGGPNEYVNLTDVINNTSIKKLWIYDSNQRTIFQFSYDLQFELSFVIDYPLFGLEQIENGIIGTPGYMNVGDEFNSIYFFSGENLITGFKPIKSSLPFNPEKSNFLHVYRHDYFSKFGDGFNYVNSFNDTIYFVDKSFSVSPKYFIDFGESKVLNEELLGKGYTSIVDLFQYINNEEKSYNIGNVIEFDKYLLYRFFDQGKAIISIYNKLNKNVFSADNIEFNYKGKTLSIKLDEEMVFGKVDDNLAYLIIPSENSVLGEYQNLFEVQDGDNPLILFFNEK